MTLLMQHPSGFNHNLILDSFRVEAPALLVGILQLAEIPRRLVAIALVEISVVESKQIRIITHGADCGVLGRVIRETKTSGPAMSFFGVN